MQSIQSRRWAFQASGLWLGLAGLSVLFPALATQIFSMQIVNVGLSSEMGGLALATAAMAFLSATDPKRYGLMWLPFAVGFTFNALINIFYLINGHYTLSNSLPNLIFDPILVIWLWLSRSLEG